MAKATDDEYEWIFVKYVTTRDGRRIYASSYGLQAFRIKVRRRKKAK